MRPSPAGAAAAATTPLSAASLSDWIAIVA